MTDAAVRRAEKPVRKLREIYGGLMAYLVINTLLVVIDRTDGTGSEAFLGASSHSFDNQVSRISRS